MIGPVLGFEDLEIKWDLGLLVWWGDSHARFPEECYYCSLSEGLREEE